MALALLARPSRATSRARPTYPEAGRPGPGRGRPCHERRIALPHPRRTDCWNRIGVQGRPLVSRAGGARPLPELPGLRPGGPGVLRPAGARAATSTSGPSCSAGSRRLGRRPTTRPCWSSGSALEWLALALSVVAEVTAPPAGPPCPPPDEPRSSRAWSASGGSYTPACRSKVCSGSTPPDPARSTRRPNPRLDPDPPRAARRGRSRPTRWRGVHRVASRPAPEGPLRPWPTRPGELRPGGLRRP